MHFSLSVKLAIREALKSIHSNSDCIVLLFLAGLGPSGSQVCSGGLRGLYQLLSAQFTFGELLRQVVLSISPGLHSAVLRRQCGAGPPSQSVTCEASTFSGVPHPMVLQVYSWLSVQASLLAYFEDHNGEIGIEMGPAA